MAEATAGVAGLRTARAVGLVATGAVVTTTLGAVAGNVTDLAALVALLAATGSTAVASTTAAALGALARQVTGLATAVAGALLGRLGALAVWRRWRVSWGTKTSLSLTGEKATKVVSVLLTDVALTTAVVAIGE